MKTKFLTAIIFVLTFSTAFAQNSRIMYFMDLPQNHFLNPALKPSGSLYIGLPVITGINLDFANNYLSFTDLARSGVKLSESSVPILNQGFDKDGFLSRLKERNYFGTDASVQFLGAGFYAGKDLYLFFDVTGQVEENIVVPRDMFRLALMGNQYFGGQTFDFSDFRAEAVYYNEFGFGFSRNITPKLRIGARAKLLFGVARGSVIPNSLKLTVNNDYSNTLYSDIEVKIAAPLNFYIGAENKVDSIHFDETRFRHGRNVAKFLTGSENKGAGLDIGAEYDINDRFSVSASVTGLGFINWKRDSSDFRTKNIIQLDGQDLADVYEGKTTAGDFAESLVDSLKKSLVYVGNRSFTSVLPSGLTVAGKYVLNDKFSFGVLSYSRLIDRQIREAITLSAMMNLGDVFSANLAYTASNRNYSNIGIGMSVKAGFARFYFMVDRIPLRWSSLNTGGSKIPVPSNWNTVNTWFGLDLVFGHNPEKIHDRPILNDNNQI